MTEADFLADVGVLATRLGLRWAHFEAPFRGRHDVQGDRGFPDLVIGGDRGVIFAELKMPGGTLGPGQHAWKWRLLASGQAWRLWYPADLENGTIEAEFRHIT